MTFATQYFNNVGLVRNHAVRVKDAFDDYSIPLVTLNTVNVKCKR